MARRSRQPAGAADRARPRQILHQNDDAADTVRLVFRLDDWQGGETTQLRLQGLSSYRRHTQLDAGYLGALGSALADDPLASGVRFFANETIYESAGRIRYADAPEAGQTQLEFRSTRITPHLTHVLHVAAHGATRSELVNALRLRDAGIAEADAAAFVQKAIAGGLLKNGLIPPITGPAPLDGLLAACADAGLESTETRALRDVASQLTLLDQQGIGCASRYDDILAPLPGTSAQKRADRILTANLIKPADAVTLGVEPMGEVYRAIDILQRLGVPDASHADSLARFRQEFSERYGSRHVRLVDLLDDDTGLEWGTDGTDALSPLIAQLSLGREPPAAATARVPATHEQLWKRILAASARRDPELILQPADVRGDGEPSDRLPDSFHLAITLDAESDEACANGRFRLLVQGVSGPPGTRTIGRCCHSDVELHAFVLAEARAEARLRPDAIVAEIAYAPLGSARGVALRPVVRDYEIPYLGRSGAPRERHIAVSDVWVSVSGDRIALYSERLQREIVPRLTSAHAYSAPGNPRLYRLLCAIARTAMPVRLFWEAVSPRPAYLPRVVWGRIVLSRASWQLDAHDLSRVAAAPRGIAQFRAIQALRRHWHWPRHIGFVAGENVLLVDLDNVLSTASLAALLRPLKTAALFVEWLPEPERQSVRGPEGRFVHELLIPLTRRRPRDTVDDRRASAPVSLPTHRAQRVFHPGSEWSYFKLYANASAADRLLRDVIAPMLASWLAHGRIDRWFFLRYQDPDSHLRLRVRSSGSSWLATQLDDLRDALDREPARSLVRRLQCESYEREVERYGGLEGLDVSERLFEADSACVMALLSDLPTAALGGRWTLAAIGVDTLLEDFGLSLEDKERFARSHRDGWWRHHDATAALRGELAGMFRQERAGLTAALAGRSVEAIRARPAFARRSRRITGLVQELARLERAGALAVSPLELLHSYVHMHVNRMLPARQTIHELVISDFLLQTYAARLARHAHGQVDSLASQTGARAADDATENVGPSS